MHRLQARALQQGDYTHLALHVAYAMPQSPSPLAYNALPVCTFK